jgi:hypothetical protein
MKNRSNETVTYEIDIIPLLKHEQDAHDIGPSIIYFPRRVTLEPGAVQTVRWLAQAGYTGKVERARFRFQTSPSATGGGRNVASKGPSAGVQILFGLSVPIVRGGK